MADEEVKFCPRKLFDDYINSHNEANLKLSIQRIFESVGSSNEKASEFMKFVSKHGDEFSKQRVAQLLSSLLHAQPSWAPRMLEKTGVGRSSVIELIIGWVQQETDVELLTQCMLLLVAVLPYVPVKVLGFLNDIFKGVVFFPDFLIDQIKALHSKDVCCNGQSIVLVLIAYRTLICYLYGMYPHKFLRYLRTHFWDSAVDREIYFRIIEPVIASFGFNVNLLRYNAEEESLADRWQRTNHSEIAMFCDSLLFGCEQCLMVTTKQSNIHVQPKVNTECESLPTYAGSNSSIAPYEKSNCLPPFIAPHEGSLLDGLISNIIHRNSLVSSAENSSNNSTGYSFDPHPFFRSSSWSVTGASRPKYVVNSGASSAYAATGTSSSKIMRWVKNRFANRKPPSNTGTSSATHVHALSAGAQNPQMPVAQPTKHRHASAKATFPCERIVLLNGQHGDTDETCNFDESMSHVPFEQTVYQPGTSNEIEAPESYFDLGSGMPGSKTMGEHFNALKRDQGERDDRSFEISLSMLNSYDSGATSDSINLRQHPSDVTNRIAETKRRMTCTLSSSDILTLDYCLIKGKPSYGYVKTRLANHWDVVHRQKLSAQNELEVCRLEIELLRTSLAYERHRCETQMRRQRRIFGLKSKIQTLESTISEKDLERLKLKKFIAVILEQAVSRSDFMRVEAARCELQASYGDLKNIHSVCESRTAQMSKAITVLEQKLQATSQDVCKLRRQLNETKASLDRHRLVKKLLPSDSR